MISEVGQLESPAVYGGPVIAELARRAPARSLQGLFLSQVEKLGSKTFMRFYADDSWDDLSWSEVAEQALRIAAGLIRAGVESGDRVLLVSENRIEWILCDLGIQLSGAVTVPVYATSTPATTRLVAGNSGAVVAIVSTIEQAAKLRVQDPLRSIVRMDGAGKAGDALSTWTDALVSAEEIRLIAGRLERVRPDDLATIVYTSGTTGAPKGVMLLQSNFADMAESCLQVFDVGGDDLTLSFLPYAHVLERMSGTVIAIKAGATVCLGRGMEHLVEDIQEVRPTIMLGVPRLFEKVVDGVAAQVSKESVLKRAIFRWGMWNGKRSIGGHPGPVHRLQMLGAERMVLAPLRQKVTGGRLRFFISGGAPLNRAVEEFFWAMGVKILQGWGMTETTSGATSNREDTHRWGSVGIALPGVQLQIADDGEILTRGPGMMAGYYRNPSATADTIDTDGWLHTGDIGHLDEDGYLFITDRKKDLIKTSGGKYIAPLMLESQLERNRAIKSAITIGDERPYVTALLVPDWGALAADHGITGDPAVLIADQRVGDLVEAAVEGLNAELAHYETIKRYTILPQDFAENRDELTPTGKLKRNVIREHFAVEIEDLYSH